MKDGRVNCRIAQVNIVLIGVSLLLSGGGVCGKPVLSKHAVTIIVSYDGFRYDYMNKTDTPNLDRLKRDGASVPYMKNQYLTNTFPNHHSIATGLYIESHGIVANYFYDKYYEKLLSGYKDDPGFWNYSSEVLPLWAANELAGEGRASGVMMWPGSNEPWGPSGTYATYRQGYNKTYPYEQRIDDIISWITDPKKPANCIFVYFDEPDSTGHKYGPEGPEMIKAIRAMDKLTGYFLDKLDGLNITEDVNLIFLSDHGMEEIHQEDFIPHLSFLKNDNDTKYRTFGGSPTLQILPNNKNETMEIFNAFNQHAKEYNFSALLTANLSHDRPDWHYSNLRRVMPILLVGDLGHVFEDYGKRTWNHSTGVHGFNNGDNLNMFPYFIASGPMFKKNVVVDPFENIDIYPFLCIALGISHHHVSNGTWERMLPLLKDKVRKELFEKDYETRAITAITAVGIFLVIVAAIFMLKKYCTKRGEKDDGISSYTLN